MARRTVVHLVDDLTGEELAPGTGETLRLGLDGAMYELDLSPANAARLRGDLARYVGVGRRLGRDGRVTWRPIQDVDPRAVRAWAASNGVDVSNRGRIPAAVVEQYRAAGH